MIPPGHDQSTAQRKTQVFPCGRCLAEFPSNNRLHNHLRRWECPSKDTTAESLSIERAEVDLIDPVNTSVTSNAKQTKEADTSKPIESVATSEQAIEKGREHG